MFGKWKFYRQHCERQKSPSPLGKGLLYFFTRSCYANLFTKTVNFDFKFEALFL
jgi:hypothetical protein